MRRGEFITLLGGAAAARTLAVRAQQNPPVIGWLWSASAKDIAGVEFGKIDNGADCIRRRHVRDYSRQQCATVHHEHHRQPVRP